MLKRNYLPLLAKLNFQIDIERLRNEFFEFGYDDFDRYDGLSYSKDKEDGLIVRRVLLEHFLTDEEKAEREGQEIAEGGEAYKMLCLTEFNGDQELHSRKMLEKMKASGLNPRQFARRMEKISTPSHPDYSPIADEKMYNRRNELCKGYVSEVMDLVEKHVGPVARTRYSVLKAGQKVRPHLDINTDKAVRIHIPLITDPKVTVGVRGKKAIVEQHMPADGGVWFLNQGYEHWVHNDSDCDRVHLVLVVCGQGGILDADKKWLDGDVTRNEIQGEASSF